jgi:two-component system NarL family sensor kinase
MGASPHFLQTIPATGFWKLALYSDNTLRYIPNMRRSLLAILVICLLFLVGACRQSDRNRQPAAAAGKEIKAFRSQLDSLKGIEDQGQRSVAIRKLYSKAAPGVRNAVCEDMLLATVNILLQNSNADSGLLPFHKRLVSDSSLYPKNRAAVSLRLANYYAHVTGDADSAARYLQEVYRHRDILGDTLVAKLYACAAQVFQLRGRMREASDNLYKSISVYEKMNDTVRASGVSINLANVYRAMNDYKKSIEVRKKLVAYFESTNDGTAEVTAAVGLASDYVDTDKPDSARIYFARAEKLFEGGVQQAVAKYYLYLSKGGMYVTLKRFDSSTIYFDKAKALLPLFNDEMQNILFTITSSIAYSNIRDVRKEAKVIEEAVPILITDNNLQVVRDAYYSLYSIALNQKIGHDAIYYYQQYDSVKAVLADRENREYVTEMESKYESQKKSLKIQVQQKELQRRKTLNAILLLSVILVALAAGFTIVRLQLLRSRREARLQTQFTKNLLRNTEEERGRIAAELHDGIGHELLTLKNNLMQSAIASESRINAITELCATGQSYDVIAPQLAILKNGMQQRGVASESRTDAIIGDIRMLSRNLHPVMLDQIGLEHSVRHLCEQLVHNGQLFVATTIDYSNQLSRYEELQVYRIIQESLTNTRKYAAAIAAQVIIATKDNQVVVTIMDNGKGFDVNEKMKSESVFGLNSMVQRSKALNAEISINSSADGTIINLEIPIRNADHHHS